MAQPNIVHCDARRQRIVAAHQPFGEVPSGGQCWFPDRPPRPAYEVTAPCPSVFAAASSLVLAAPALSDAQQLLSFNSRLGCECRVILLFQLSARASDELFELCPSPPDADTSGDPPQGELPRPER